VTYFGGNRVRLRIFLAAMMAWTLAGTLALGSWGVFLVAPAASASTLTARTGVSAKALVQAYVSGRHLPAGAVAGIRAHSLHTASVAGARWAIADFTPSASDAAKVKGEFQDGASTGILRQVPGKSWRLVQTGPYGCGRGLPAGLRQAWGLPAPIICQAALTTQRSAASAARTQARTIGQSIANIALGQVGVGSAPAVSSFNGVDCDPYTTMDGSLSPNADGCGLDSHFKVEDENEFWCADFARWVWEQAGITTDTSALTAGAGSFYEWGLAQHETIKADKGTPAAGDAVVFFPPGALSSYADHVGIVTGVNSGGTINLVNGDYLGKSNISVEYDTKVSLTKYAAQIWGPGEQWVLVAPPTGTQRPAPVPVISGSHVAVAGTVASFKVSGTVSGGSVTQYQWTFGYNRNANEGGSSVSTVFPSAGAYPVTVTATSSLGTIATRTWDIDVLAASSTATSIPSDAVWYSTTPTGQYVFLPTATGGLAAESSDGAAWLQQAIPGQLGTSGEVTALAYPDPAVSDVMTPHAYFRSASGTLAQTYLGSAGWTTHTLAGQPEAGSALAATTAGDPPGSGTEGNGGSVPAVFYFGAAGQLSESTEHGSSWVTGTLPGPDSTDATSLALANTAGGGAAGLEIFYLGTKGALTVASGTSSGWKSASITSSYGVGADTPLSAISTGPDQASVFFVDGKGMLAEATGAGSSWTVHQLSGTSSTTALVATSDLLSSGSPGWEVFWLTRGGQPAVTTQAGKTTMLPGTATSIPAVSAFPVAGQPLELFLADGSTLRLDQSPAPGDGWTATILSNTAVTLADRVLLYAATSADDTSARSAASAAGLPASAVTESFSTAWAATLSGNYLVIAVGAAADDALYYNACGWADPSDEGAGGTPFALAASEPLDKLPGVAYYEDGAAATTSQTPARATDLAYYAVHGKLPAGVTKLPAQATPQGSCSGSAG